MHTQKLIIGIDYGTTNSGAAYALLADPNDEHVEIKVIKRWPHGGLNRDGSDKLPSEIAYNESGTPAGYGFDIPGDAAPLQWVKLLLEPEHFNGKEKTPNTERVWRSYRELERLGKRPVDVIADYLAWLWQRIVESIKKTEDPDVFKDADVIVVLTVPAQWSDKAKDRMLQAAKKAGIETDKRTLRFRSEPEAAAIFELKGHAKKRRVDVGDCVILCDAGGGTVDVVTYQVRSRGPLSVDQVIVSKGDLCGSTFINSEFDSQVRSILGSDFEKLEPSVRKQIWDEFEYRIKRIYNPEKSEVYSIPVTGLPDDKSRGIKDGKLILDNAVLRASFETIMTQTMTLIDSQKDELRAKQLEEKLKGILLVGGFGGSDYLHTRIRQEYPEEDGIRIWQGDESWTSVVQGAVACEAARHENHRAIATRLSSYNYGIPYRQGSLRRIQWLLRKGQAVSSSTHSEPYLLRMEDQPWLDEDEYAIILVQLIKTAEDNVGEELDSSARPHVEISCRVPTAIRHSSEAMLIQQDPKVWQIPADLVVALDGPILSAKCRIKEQDVGAVDLNYHDQTEHMTRRSESAGSARSLPRRPSKDAADSFLSNHPGSPSKSPSSSKHSSTDRLNSRRTFSGSWLFSKTKRVQSKENKEKKPKPEPERDPSPAADGSRRVRAEGRIVKAPPQ